MEYGDVGVQQKIHQQAVPESVIKWRMSTYDTINMQIAALLGKQYNEKTKKYEATENGIATCNERGAAYAKTFLTSTINPSTIQGNIDTDQYYAIMQFAADAITDDIGKKYREFGIHPDNRGTFITTILQTIALVLTRPIQNLEREGAIQQSQEKVTTTQGIHSVMPHYPQQVQ
jgi:hypothetical protein